MLLIERNVVCYKLIFFIYVKEVIIYCFVKILFINNIVYFYMYKFIKKIVFEFKNKVILSRMYFVWYFLMCFCFFKERCICYGDFLENYISIINSSDINLNNIVW